MNRGYLSIRVPRTSKIARGREGRPGAESEVRKSRLRDARRSVECLVPVGEDSRAMASAGSEIWLQWFACCYQPQVQVQRTRRRIDRSMIGNPTNFQHTGHIGMYVLHRIY